MAERAAARDDGRCHRLYNSFGNLAGPTGTGRFAEAVAALDRVVELAEPFEAQLGHMHRAIAECQAEQWDRVVQDADALLRGELRPETATTWLAYMQRRRRGRMPTAATPRPSPFWANYAATGFSAKRTARAPAERRGPRSTARATRFQSAFVRPLIIVGGSGANGRSKAAHAMSLSETCSFSLPNARERTRPTLRFRVAHLSDSEVRVDACNRVMPVGIPPDVPAAQQKRGRV